MRSIDIGMTGNEKGREHHVPEYTEKAGALQAYLRNIYGKFHRVANELGSVCKRFYNYVYEND